MEDDLDDSDDLGFSPTFLEMSTVSHSPEFFLSLAGSSHLSNLFDQVDRHSIPASSGKAPMFVGQTCCVIPGPRAERW